MSVILMRSSRRLGQSGPPSPSVDRACHNMYSTLVRESRRMLWMRARKCEVLDLMCSVSALDMCDSNYIVGLVSMLGSLIDQLTQK